MRRQEDEPNELDSMETLSPAEDSKDDVVELRTRDKEKATLYRAIGDLHESTTFWNETDSSWHDEADQESRVVPVLSS
jgi:hypothetical protein